MSTTTVYTIKDSKSRLFKINHCYKPFAYPDFFDMWKKQQSMHWISYNINLALDVHDWQTKLTEEERNLLTQIFRFFTQADIEVGNCYINYYMKIFGPTEIKMMLAAFVNMETIHIEAYAYLLDTIGMPEIEYQAFMKYKAMKDKWEYMQNFGGDSVQDVAMTLAVFGAFTEGLQLFASFAMLLNFTRFNKMKGMGQIVTYSIRDETLHTHSLIKLFRIIIAEHPTIWTEGFKQKIIMACRTIVEHEDAFIDLAFEMGDITGLTRHDMKDYIRYIADRRLEQLMLEPIYMIAKNPLPWMDTVIAVEHANFFELRATEYGKYSGSQDRWEEVFA